MASQRKPPRALHGMALLGGILVVMLGLGLLGNELSSLGWRLEALLFYKEGVARVVATEVYQREGVFEVETTYRLEWHGRIGKNTATLDLDERWVSTREEAIARQSRITVGKLYPCWYAPDAPETVNVLAPEGLRWEDRLPRLVLPAIVIAAGICLVRFGWKELAGKEKSRDRS